MLGLYGSGTIIRPTDTILSVQGNTNAIGQGLISTYNTGTGSGGLRNHIRMINGVNQIGYIGMLDSSRQIIIGANNQNFIQFSDTATTLNSVASGSSQNNYTLNAANGNSSGRSVGLLLNNTGTITGTGSAVTSFRINNTQTLPAGIQLLMEAQRNSNTVFRIDMSGAISAGTVSNATQSFWKLGKPITASASLNTNSFMEINVDGTTYKLALIL